jgi:hypothetical protein
MKTEPAAVTGDGGNATLVNQNEAEILDRTVTSIPVVIAPGGADDFSYVNPRFRESAIGGA